MSARTGRKGPGEAGVGYVKNFLAGLDIADFSVLAPAAHTGSIPRRQCAAAWRRNANHPLSCGTVKSPYLGPLPLHPFDIATVSQVRASRQFRITLDTSRYSVPAHLAGQADAENLSRPALPLHHNQLVARHHAATTARVISRTPIIPSRCWSSAKSPRSPALYALSALSPQAELYYRQLEQRHLSPRHHVRQDRRLE